MGDRRLCELCERRAAVYCCADEAYVCWDCDSKVHGANFIVARHLRSVLCRRCEAPTSVLASSLINHGAHNPQIAPLCCPTCDSSTDLQRLPLDHDAHPQSVHSEQSTTQETGNAGEEEVTSSLSTMNSNGATSISISSTSATKSSKKCSGKRRSRSPSPDSVIPEAGSGRKRSKDHEAEITRVTEERLEQILRQWNKQLGIDQSNRVVSLAMQLLRKIAGSIRSNQLEKLDARAALAVCFWMALKLDCSSSRMIKASPPPSISTSAASSSSSHSSSSSPPPPPPSASSNLHQQDHCSVPPVLSVLASVPASNSSVAMVPRLDKFGRCTGVSAEVLLSVEAKLCQVLHTSTHLT